MAENCGNCRYWESPDDLADQGLCILISDGESAEKAQVIGRNGGDADFLCASDFYCNLYAQEMEIGLDDVPEIGGSESESVEDAGIGLEPGARGRWQP